MLNSQSFKPKLLYIVTQAEWGGAQRYIFDLAARLATDFDITVAMGADGASQELIRKIQDTPHQNKFGTGRARHKIQTIKLKHLKRQINLPRDILAIFEIAKLYRRLKPDIVHLNSSKAGAIGAFAAIGCRLSAASNQPKIIYTVHGWVYLEPLPPYKRWIYLMMEKLAAQFRDATIVLSEKEKNIALKYKTAKKESLYIIPNGIEPEGLNFLSREEATNILDIPDTKNIVIGTIANFYKTKGLEYLIEAIHILNSESKIPNSRFVIIGDGPERRNLELRIKNYGLGDKIILAGAIPEAYRCLQAFEIFVLPSVKEGFPYAILEAMAAGLPIVATAVGAIPEIIENQKNGHLVPPANAQALARAIADLILNRAQAERLGANARAASNKFSLDKMVNETKIIYQKSISTTS